MDTHALKQDILATALDLFESNGVSRETLARAAEKAGHASTLARILFPDGIPQALSLLHAQLDTQMETALKEAWQADWRTPQIVTSAIRARLTLMQEKSAGHRAIGAYILHPARFSLLQKHCFQTVNRIWYMAGDTATDYNYYTKRGLLAYVYESTLLYWLKNPTQDLEATFQFMERRFSQVAKIPKAKAKAAHVWQQLISRLPFSASAP